MVQHHLARLLICTAAIIAIAFCSSVTCFAEPILLAQMYHSETQGEDNGHRFNFLFMIATVESSAEISRMPTSADVGQTFPADAATVAMFHDPGGQIISAFGPPGMVTPSGIGIGDFFNGPFTSGEFPTVPVPENRLIMKEFISEPAFRGYYRITGVDQTIDGLSIEPQNATRSLYWGAQTIRIFGERIPEPTSLLLIMSGLVGLAWRQHRFFRSRGVGWVWTEMPNNRE
jgi:hypothetical protein